MSYEQVDWNVWQRLLPWIFWALAVDGLTQQAPVQTALQFGVLQKAN